VFNITSKIRKPRKGERWCGWGGCMKVVKEKNFFCRSCMKDCIDWIDKALKSKEKPKTFKFKPVPVTYTFLNK